VLNYNPRPSIAIGDIAEVPVVTFGLPTYIILGAVPLIPTFIAICIPALAASFSRAIPHKEDGC